MYHPLELQKPALKKNIIQFGAVQINVRQLAKSRLLVCYPSGGPVKQLGKAQKITEGFTDLLIGILQIKSIDPVLQQRLSMPESQLLATLMRVSRLGPVLSFAPYSPSIEEHLARYDVLRGALNAGLDHAPEVLHELMMLTKLLTVVGRIKEKDSVWICALLEDLEEK